MAPLCPLADFATLLAALCPAAPLQAALFAVLSPLAAPAPHGVAPLEAAPAAALQQAERLVPVGVLAAVDAVVEAAYVLAGMGSARTLAGLPSPVMALAPVCHGMTAEMPLACLLDSGQCEALQQVFAFGF